MKKRLAIVAGGNSGEFEISIQSGYQVLENVDREYFEPYMVIMRRGEWTCKLQNGENQPVDKNDFSVALGKRKIQFDVVFIAIHGSPGEDGKLQGYFDLLGLPYTSCNHVVSAITFDKFYCKKIVGAFGVPTPKAMILRNRNFNIGEIISELQLPVLSNPTKGDQVLAFRR